MVYQTNYAGLKADLIQNSDDFSSDFLAHLDTIIAEGETKLLRDLDLEIFQDEITNDAAGNPLALTINQRTFSRPSGVVKINGIWLGTSRKFIEKRTKGYCEAYGEDPSVKERPTYYAEQSEDYLYFVNTPDQAYPLIAYGIVRPAGLSDTNATTWLSTYAGDLLFMACKIRAEEYLVNPGQATVWQNDYQNDLLPKAKIELRGMSRASYEAARTVAPPSQTL